MGAVDTSSVFVTRPFTGEDRSWVIFTWLESYLASREARLMGTHARELVWGPYAREVEQLIARHPPLMAAHKRTGVLLGWVCRQEEPLRLHYLVLRRGFAELRSALLQALVGDLWSRGLEYTSELCDLQGVPEAWRYNPYARRQV